MYAVAQQGAGASAWAASPLAGDLKASGRSSLMLAVLLPSAGLFVNLHQKYYVKHDETGIFLSWNCMHWILDCHQSQRLATAECMLYLDVRAQ